MLLYKQNKKKKKNQALKGNRLLISITVVGSAGPLRFVVNEDEVVAAVIKTALKSYARQGRLPILPSHPNSFMLYCPIPGTEALHPWKTIGSVGVRNFLLCKKPESADNGGTESDDKASAMSRKGAGSWRAWFYRSHTLKISSH
ncbi:hypothetical protein BUALT_Bualt17G0110300 [Buddleja alternifolia]|uniref:DUF7054 domain-containing protein n=1 Tax=Buddleja alternifolia TaxID=168488 RepID=A0AAV6WIC0_9LAMI|nr:hypothetical protein BUALT_Bualt17G0110300 [Buddleja alternifolia]